MGENVFVVKKIYIYIYIVEDDLYYMKMIVKTSYLDILLVQYSFGFSKADGILYTGQSLPNL